MSLSPASPSWWEAVAWAIRLARPDSPAPPTSLEWERVRTIAVRERLAMLCWLRNGNVIRRSAPAAVVAAWRRHAIAAESRHNEQLELLRATSSRLGALGIDVVLLKGAALAVLAHGDPSARVSTDLDLLIDAQHRDLARSALAAAGWRRRSGTPPFDETFELRRGGRTLFLELHSGLLHDTLVHHDLRASSFTSVDIGGVVVRTLDGPELPVYLAAHAVSHDMPALLWLADLEALWSRSSPSERERARNIASRAGLGRHLEWGVAQAEQLASAGRGSRAALQRLGFGEDGERADRPFLRSLRLAPSPVARVRVAGAWLWPRPLRRSRTATLELLRSRLARLLGGGDRARGGPSDAFMLTSPVGSADGVGPRTLELGRVEFCELLGDLIPLGTRVWVTVRGASMSPAIPPGSEVRLGPVGERSLRTGEVVLARLASGLPVLHRVRESGRASVILQGDALPEPDAAIAHAAVIARAEAVRTDGVERPVPTRRARPWRRIGSAWKRRLMPPGARLDPH